MATQTNSATSPVLPLASSIGSGGSLASRMQRAKLGQGRALAEQRERKEDAAEIQVKEAAAARGDLSAEQVRMKTPEEKLHDIKLKDFNALFDPVMAYMGCNEAERTLVRTEWSTPAQIDATLEDWRTKVVVYDIEVSDSLRAKCHDAFRIGFVESGKAAVLLEKMDAEETASERAAANSIAIAPGKELPEMASEVRAIEALSPTPSAAPPRGMMRRIGGRR